MSKGLNSLSYILGLPFMESKASWVVKKFGGVSILLTDCYTNLFSTVNVPSYKASNFNHMHAQLCIGIR